MKSTTLALAVAVLAAPAVADITVVFDEGAPKDRFTVTNSGNCPLANIEVEIDLGASAAGLIFDVTDQGAGVEVFQPLELVSGQEFLTSVPRVLDGDTNVILKVETLPAGASTSFTIDVDDTAGTNATMISGAEIEGAMVKAVQGERTYDATFNRDAVASIAIIGCQA